MEGCDSSYTYTVTVSSSTLLADGTVKYRLFCFVVFVFVLFACLFFLLCFVLFCFVFLKDDLISGSD